ncbi:uncharacterized protein LOC121107855 isoform X3 [Gallus gallus]|nr:uncharacterized protein LOC121107855 isoform X3 [Gallus gallus]
MLGEAQWTMACPRVPALLLLVVVGTLQAPLLYLNTSRAQEGEIVLAQCILQTLVPAVRIVFCKDGMEFYSMKAHQHTVIYSKLLNISARSRGTYACGYQQRKEEKSLEMSTLSAPLDLQVTGHVSNSSAGTVTADTNTPLNLTVIHVVSVTVTLLLSAATFWTIRKGACRERCRRKGLPWCWRRKDFLMAAARSQPAGASHRLRRSPVLNHCPLSKGQASREADDPQQRCIGFSMPRQPGLRHGHCVFLQRALGAEHGAFGFMGYALPLFLATKIYDLLMYGPPRISIKYHSYFRDIGKC